MIIVGIAFALTVRELEQNIQLNFQSEKETKGGNNHIKEV